MAQYVVSPMDYSRITLQETDTVQSILQNIAVILRTYTGTCPLYRDFGITADYLDRPIPVAKTMMIADIRDAINEWEPRAGVLGITFTEDTNLPGRLIPTVEVEINGQ